MLNFDELTVVWQFMPIEEIVCCYRLVSREWNEAIIHNNILWHHLCNYYLRNDLFRFDQDDEIKLLMERLQFDEENSSNCKENYLDHQNSQFYYQLFRMLYFYPKITELREHKWYEIKKRMSLPDGFENFYNADENSGRVSRFGFVATLISSLSVKENVQLNYLNDRIKIGNSDGKEIVTIPLCSLFAAIIFCLGKLSGLYGGEIILLTPKRLPRSERFPIFRDLWYTFEEKLSLDNTALFMYSLNVNYEIFKKSTLRIEFTSDWKELVLEVEYWFD